MSLNNLSKIHNIKAGYNDFCQITGDKNLAEVIDFGQQPLCDTLLSKEDLNKPERYYPLKVLRNKKLGHAQLNYTVDPNTVFYKKYPYLGGITKEVVLHHEVASKENIKMFSIKPKSLVVDVGSNDGTLLEQYLKQNMKVVGVEPTDIANIANSRGIETIKKPFDLQVAKKIKKKYGFSKLITSTNVFAHIARMGDCILGMKHLMNNGSVLMIENHYMPFVIKYNQFDTFYHEHLRTYSFKSLIYLLKMYGIKIFDARVTDRYGGTIRIFASLDHKRKTTVNYHKILQDEKLSGLYKDDIWMDFSNNIKKMKIKTLNLLTNLKKNNKTIAANSCPGRCSTLLNYYGVGTEIIPYIGEQKGSLKIGKFLPGMHIPIVRNTKLYKDQPDFVILLAWHYSKQIIKELRERGLKSKLIIPLPDLKIIQ